MSTTRRRTGIIHQFDPDTRAAFLRSQPRGMAVPVVVYDGDGEDAVEIGRGQFKGGYFAPKTHNLIGNLEWPDGVEAKIGKKVPVVYPEFNDDGSIREITVRLDADDTTETPITPRSKPMAKVKLQIDPDETPEDAFERLVGHHNGDPAALAIALIGQNRKFMGMIQEERSKIPADHVVVPKADADALAAYRELDADPKTLRKRLDTGEEASNSLAANLRKSTLKDVAEKFGYKGTGSDVFTKLADDAGLEFEPITLKDRKTGKDFETYRAKAKRDGKEIYLSQDELESGDWKAYLPALHAEPEAPNRPERPVSATGFRGSQFPNLEFGNMGPNRNGIRKEESREDSNRSRLSRTGVGLM